MTQAITIEGSARAVVPAFDYGTLEPKTAEAAKAATSRIRRRVSGQIKSILETGDDLLHIKEMLGHGQFTAWLTAEFNMTDRTARNYMMAASAFKEKMETVSGLAPTTVYMLAAAVEPVRATVLEQIENGERLPDPAIRDMIAEARRKEQQEKAAQRLTPEQRKARKAREDRQQRERDKVRAKFEQEVEARRAARQKAAALVVQHMPEHVSELVQLLKDANEISFARQLGKPLEAISW